jgi:hypothetical protein
MRDGAEIYPVLLRKPFQARSYCRLKISECVLVGKYFGCHELTKMRFFIFDADSYDIIRWRLSQIAMDYRYAAIYPSN